VWLYDISIQTWPVVQLLMAFLIKPDNLLPEILLFYTTMNEVGTGWNFGAAFTNLGSKLVIRMMLLKKILFQLIGLGAVYTKTLTK
jgi:hypothetical protein